MDSNKLYHTTNFSTRKEFDKITSSLIFLLRNCHDITIPTSLVNELFSFCITEYWLKNYDLSPIRTLVTIANLSQFKGFNGKLCKALEKYTCHKKEKNKYVKRSKDEVIPEDQKKYWINTLISGYSNFFGSTKRGAAPRLSEQKSSAQARGNGAWTYS
jgi:uncharacterized protein YihD (DUF1040 family)